jgi:CO dehydrogenase maturation factor
MAGLTFVFGGKGGSGKTTLAAMVLRRLLRIGRRPVLAVDADPNATLGLMLGQQVGGTIADLRDRMGEAAQTVSEIPKQRLLDQWMAELVSEGEGFDLLTMGRPEGPKCYCYVNGLLRRYLKELPRNYSAVVVDCEAGMEYLSRLTMEDIETLVLVAEATPVGVMTIRRIMELADSLPIRVHRRILVLNKVGLAGEGGSSAERLKLPETGQVVRVPFDPDLYRRCAAGEPLDDEAGGPAKEAVEELVSLCLESARELISKTERKEPIS